MKLCLGLLLGSVCLLSPRAASAQQPGVPRPVLSPYLNLLRGGQSAAVNYGALVRPDIDFRSSIQQLQVGQAVLQATEAQGVATTATGHFAAFMTQGVYFNSFTGGPAGGAGGAGAGAGFGTMGAGSGAKGGTGSTPQRSGGSGGGAR